MARVGWRMGAVVLAGVGFVLFGLLGTAQAQEAPEAVAFARTDVTVPDDGRSGLTLFNNTAAELALTVGVTPADSFAVEASAARVDPGGSVAIRVTDVGADPGTSGRVTVVAIAPGPAATQPGGVARASVTVGSPTAPVEPLVDEWTVTSYRLKPWGDTTENDVLPLRDATACDEVELPEGTVGGVASSPGSARVVASCTDEGAPGSEVGVELAFPGLGHHTGDYRGELDLAPGGESGTVALTVQRTDYLLVPLVVVLLGVAAAVAAVRRVGRLDARTAGDREALLLLAEVDDAHRTFRAKANETTWSGYSFKADADARVRAALGETLTGAPGAGRSNGSGPGRDGDAARGRLEPVAVAAAAWPLLADRLAELDVAVSEVALKASSHRPPTIGSNEPVCLAEARSLLAGRRLAVDDAVATARKVDAAATMTERWLDWVDTVAQLDSRVELLALTVDDLPSGRDDHQRLAEARSSLSTARLELWEVEDLADLEQRRTLSTIADARTLLDGLDHHVSGLSSDLGPAHEAAGTGELLPPLASQLGETLAGGGRRPGRRTDPGAARRRWRSAIALGGIGLVAAWSGLSVLYFDEAFGSPRDYLAIFVWGFAAQAVLATLAGALDRLVTAARGLVA
jgi:hypothetical protein